MDSMTTIDVIALLSACVHLGAFAGQAIRDVVASGESLGIVNKADGSVVAFDPQTIADTRAQQRIVESLRRHFGPGLVIVGEEGQLDPPAAEDILHYPSTDLLAFPRTPVELNQNLVLWIDPLDGTRKFTEKVYDDVSVLLGISYQGRPLAGVMHQPFAGPFGTTYFGGPAVNGVFQCQLSSDAPSTWNFSQLQTPQPPSRPKQIVGVSESPCQFVDRILPSLDMQIVAKGSTGRLLLDVVLGEVDVYYRYVNRTKRWDTCVGEAFLSVFGGRLTDRFGQLYDYNAATNHDNVNGVVAALDPALLAVVVEKTHLE
ncbi:hypothetical protein LEN26_002995 [Aphanomyces euteiches]|nr:hypothetical protein AeMF1_003720 [Aphanomyces euteiches]KAH9158407.1 hypothetical protein LEN26_002995 [Aphanomyces euteiches]KAH9194340.1 hypothetical protein AeNC1_003696 [Aphanomyces euteiches]